MFRCRNAGSTDSGFTLVEVLVSLAAMAIGFAILMGLHYSSLRLQSNDDRRTQALQIARANIEELRNPSKLNGTTCPIAPGSTQYTCSVNAPPTPWSGPVTVTVTVEWRDRLKMSGGTTSLSTTNSRVQLTTIYNGEHPFSPS